MKNKDIVVLTQEKKRNYFRAFQTAFKIFKDEIAKDKNFEINNNIVASIINKYDNLGKCLKQAMNHTHRDENIDSHKIASIFLVLILKNHDVIIPPALKEKGEDSTFYHIPHIYFGFILGVVIMESIHNIDKEDKITYDVNTKYGKEFAKMIFANKKAIITPAISAECNESIKGIFCLSHIFYFIERTADKL